MSSDEESQSSCESDQEETPKPLNSCESDQEETPKPLKKTASEAEMAMKKRRELANSSGLDESAKDLLANNAVDREKMEQEIKELRLRAEKRKKERMIEEKRLADERSAEEEKRKQTEEAKKKQKYEEEEKKQKERAKKMAEIERMRNPAKPNFVIKKKQDGEDDEDEEEEEDKKFNKNKKTKEQLAEIKKQTLSQRIQPLDTQGLNSSKLAEKAKELLKIVYKLESEKYDLEKHFKVKQFDLMELAEKARSINKVGKGGLKRIQQGPDDPSDVLQEKFAGTPSKIEMYSKYERKKDKRNYEERMKLFTGPTFALPLEKIQPIKSVDWDEERMPVYVGKSGAK